MTGSRLTEEESEGEVVEEKCPHSINSLSAHSPLNLSGIAAECEKRAENEDVEGNIICPTNRINGIGRNAAQHGKVSEFTT